MAMAGIRPSLKGMHPFLLLALVFGGEWGACLSTSTLPE